MEIVALVPCLYRILIDQIALTFIKQSFPSCFIQVDHHALVIAVSIIWQCAGAGCAGPCGNQGLGIHRQTIPGKIIIADGPVFCFSNPFTSQLILLGSLYQITYIKGIQEFCFFDAECLKITSFISINDIVILSYRIVIDHLAHDLCQVIAICFACAEQVKILQQQFKSTFKQLRIIWQARPADIFRKRGHDLRGVAAAMIDRLFQQVPCFPS